MTITVNGESRTIESGVTLAAFLTREGFDLQRVAVERNGSIVPRRTFDSEILTAADKLEVVHFVGGG